MSTEVVFVLYDTDGNPQPSIDLSGAGVCRIAHNGGAYANRAGSAPTSIEDGQYTYTLDSTEEAQSGFALFKVKLAGYRLVCERVDFGALSLGFGHRSGRTILGLLRRIDAFVTNAANGLDGATPTFTQPDGVTTEFSATQDTTAGTRSSPIVTNSETP